MISALFVPLIGGQLVVPVETVVAPPPGHVGIIKFLGNSSPDAIRFRERDVIGSRYGNAYHRKYN
jgi:hypothetical protein